MSEQRCTAESAHSSIKPHTISCRRVLCVQEASWWAMLPIGVMTGMMLGLEDLAVQLEDPFKFMPYGKRNYCALVPCGSRWLFTAILVRR